MGSQIFKYSNNKDDYNGRKETEDVAFVNYASKLWNTLSIDIKEESYIFFSFFLVNYMYC